MRADRAAQLQASVVAECGPVALAQPADLDGEYGVEQGEKGEIGWCDRGQVHGCLLGLVCISDVIPGRCVSIEPGISRFRVWSFGPSRNDGGSNLALRRADPIAMEAVGHTMAEMHQRDGPRLDILGVENRQIAAVLLRAPDRR